MRIAAMVGRATGPIVAAALVAAGLHLPMTAEAASAPSVPRSVKACNKVPSTVKVTWRTPASAGTSPIDRYKVVAWSSEMARLAIKTAATKRSHTLVGLEPGPTYSFKVLAHNAQGWSPASPTAKAPVGGYASLGGACGLAAPELAAEAPTLFERRIDFADNPYDAEGELDLLTNGGQAFAAAPNPGGSSFYAELLAFEALARLEGASLVKTENEIVYDTPGKITDMSVRITGDKVGVSVTRAAKFPFGTPLPQGEAATLLDAKLDDIVASSENVSDEDAWVKQILVVMTYDDQTADTVRAAWLGLDAATRADTIVYVLVTDGSDLFIYTDAP